MKQCYPDLMFVGESKAGTTSIVAYMLSHPQVIMQTLDGGASGWSVNSSGSLLGSLTIGGSKFPAWEAHVLDKHLLSDPAVMTANWATAPWVPAEDVGKYLQMHYTPNYIYFPDTPFHIADLYPNAHSIKYFVLLREPVARAVSSWRYHSMGDLRSFEQVVEQGISQRRTLEACYAKALKKKAGASATHVEDLPAMSQRRIMNECFWGIPWSHDTTTPVDSYFTTMHAHVDKGVYVDQLRRWFSLLGRENFFVFSLEEWIQDPFGMYVQLADFAGYDAIGPNGFKDAAELRQVLSKEYNDGSVFQQPQEPSDELKETLRAFYEPYNEALFELLGRRLWNTTRP